MKTNYYSRIAALAAIVAAVGCAGEGTAHIPSGTLNFTGAETITGTSTAPATVPATGGTTVTTDAGGSATIPSGAVPAGTTLPAGTVFGIVPSGTGFLGAISPGALVTVNGTANSGGTVNSNGLLGVNLALPVAPGDAGTHYDLSLPAEVLNTSRVLHVGQIIFSGNFYIRLNPVRVVSPVPIDLRGQLPNDGENAFGSFISATWGPGNSGRTATLFIDYGNGFTLHQTQVINARGQAIFRNFVPDSSNIPATGVALVSFTIGNL